MINSYKLWIAFDFNYSLVASFCAWTSCFFIGMETTQGNDCIKRVELCHVDNVVLLLNVWKQCSISHSIVIIMHALLCCFFSYYFTVSFIKLRKSYTQKIFMLWKWKTRCHIQSSILHIIKCWLREAITKIYQGKSWGKLGDII